MVSPEIYFYNLHRALRANHIRGYAIDKKCNGKTCIYMNNGKWIVAEIKEGKTIEAVEYNNECLWGACEDIITRLAKDKEQREKVWMDWASPTGWAEKMDEPLALHIISKEERNGGAYSIVKEVIDAIDVYGLLKNGAPKDEFETETELIVHEMKNNSSVEEIATIISDVMNERFGLETDYKSFLEAAKKIQNRMSDLSP